MYYLDTSFIAPALIREAASTQVIDWLKKTQRIPFMLAFG
jgi:hypothetical protein